MSDPQRQTPEPVDPSAGEDTTPADREPARPEALVEGGLLGSTLMDGTPERPTAS